MHGINKARLIADRTREPPSTNAGKQEETVAEESKGKRRRQLAPSAFRCHTGQIGAARDGTRWLSAAPSSSGHRSLGKWLTPSNVRT